MEGVGARLGRSSTRYGPTTVFTGPVRKWKKKWVHVFPSNNNKKDSAAANGGAAGDVNNGSHLLLYKWTALSESNNGSSNGNGNGSVDNNSPSENAAAAGEEPTRRRFKYVPIALLEDQKKETTEDEHAEKIDEEAKPNDTDTSIVDSKDGLNEKPDINDVPMEENQEDNKIMRKDLNESTLDLSLNLNAHDGEPEKYQRT